MTIKSKTLVFMGLVILAIAVWDIYAWNTGGTEATISWAIYKWSELSAAVPFAFGFLAGHLFWQMKPNKNLPTDQPTKQ